MMGRKLRTYCRSEVTAKFSPSADGDVVETCGKALQADSELRSLCQTIISKVKNQVSFHSCVCLQEKVPQSSLKHVHQICSETVAWLVFPYL